LNCRRYGKRTQTTGAQVARLAREEVGSRGPSTRRYLNGNLPFRCSLVCCLGQLERACDWGSKGRGLLGTQFWWEMSRTGNERRLRGHREGGCTRIGEIRLDVRYGMAVRCPFESGSSSSEGFESRRMRIPGVDMRAG